MSLVRATPSHSRTRTVPWRLQKEKFLVAVCVCRCHQLLDTSDGPFSVDKQFERLLCNQRLYSTAGPTHYIGYVVIRARQLCKCSALVESAFDIRKEWIRF
jgi:hypothetical protein